MGLTKIRATQISNLDYKQSCKVLTNTDITLTGGAPALVDGVSVMAGDRVLVTGQTERAQNGIYRVQIPGTGANGTWTRTTDADQTGEVLAGMIVMVTEGTVYKDTQWKLITNDPITIGVTELDFELNSAFAFGNIFANGISVIANTVGDAVTFTAGNNIAITGNAASQTITFDVTGNSITDGTSSVAIVATNGNIRANVGGSTVQLLSTDGVTITGFITATGDVTGGNVLTAGNIECGNLTATGTVTASNIDSVNADVAERYVSDDSYPPGTVLEIGGAAEVRATQTSHSTRIVGVVSTAPALVMNSSMQSDHAVTVALLGRAPCRVMGIIQRGDLLVSSDRPGVAMALVPGQYQPGSVIGKALASNVAAEESVIEVLVGRS